MQSITEQNHYLIRFSGMHLTAHAIVLARSSEEAVELFYEEFAVEFPYIADKPECAEPIMLEFGLKRCHILDDGDY